MPHETKLTKRNAERLLKLAQFLRKLPDKLFDFATIMHEGSNKPKKALDVGGGCGTAGCAIGWMPAAFPRSLKWVPFNGAELEVRLRKNSTRVGSFTDTARFFGITYTDVQVLFDPYSSCPLGRGAKPAEVAGHIERWVANHR